MSKGFDTTPKPAFLRAMQNQKWTVGGALSELIDNSFGSGRGDARNVSIVYDSLRREISVLDNGRGMEAIGRLFQLGNTVGRSPGDIGLYGSGGTMAILWLPRKVAVWTKRDGKVNYDAITWAKEIAAERFPIVSNEWVRSTAANTPPALHGLAHGTLIKLYLARERTFWTSNVKRDIAQNYSPALRLGRVIQWETIGKGGGIDQLGEPLIMPDDQDKKVDIAITLEHQGQHLGVAGAIGIISDLPQSQSQVSIGFGPRVIFRTRDCYGSQEDQEKRYVGTGVAGWLDLQDGWQPYLSTTKDAINDEPLRKKLMHYVFTQIEPLLKQVQSDKLTLVLDNIGLMLTNLLNGGQATLPLAARQDSSGLLTAVGTGGRGDRGEGGGEERERIHYEPDPEGKEITPRNPPVTEIQAIPLSDEEMEGLLCRSQKVNSAAGPAIDVYMNRDHPLIDEAMKAVPPRREAFTLLMCQQIATQLADDPILAKSVFKPHIHRQLEGKDDRQREALFTRMLVDMVKR